MAGTACSRHLGSPATIRRLATAFLETGRGLEQLVAELRRAVGDVVPQEWEGSAATAFRQHSEQELETAQQAAQRARALAEAANTLADGLDGAWALYAQAEIICSTHGLYIAPNCWIYPLRPDELADPATKRAHLEAWQKGEEALRDADAARMAFRWAVADGWRDRMEILRPLAIEAAAGMIGGGRPPRPSRVGVRRPGTRLHEEVRREFEEAQRQATERERAEGRGMQEVDRLPGQQPESLERGNLVHANPRAFELRDPEGNVVRLPENMRSEVEFTYRETTVRLDGVVFEEGRIYQFKADNPAEIAQGRLDLQSQIDVMNRVMPRPDGQSWTGQVLTYDPAAPARLLRRD